MAANSSITIILRPQPNSHPFKERKCVLDSKLTKIGRSVAHAKPTTSNLIFDCKTLSRNHAVIWCADGQVYLRDTKSSNGTLINNQWLFNTGEESGEKLLKDGDVIQFGVDVMENQRQRVTHGCIRALFVNPSARAESLEEDTVLGVLRSNTPELAQFQAQIRMDAQHRQVMENKVGCVKFDTEQTASAWERECKERNILYDRPREPVSHGSGAPGAGNLPRGGVNQHYDAQLFPRDQVHAQDPPPPTSAMGHLPPEQYHHQSSAEHSQKDRPLSYQDPIGDQPSYSGDDSQRRSRVIPSPRDVVEDMYRDPVANCSSRHRCENAKRLVQDPRMTTEERYKMIELDLLITANWEKHGDQCYSVLSGGMDILEYYAFNLLRPNKRDGWGSIRCSNNIYKSRILPMVGANDLLSTLGYNTATAQEICFPPHAFPDEDRIVKMAADLLLGWAEVDLRMANEWKPEVQSKSGNVGFAEGSSAQIPNSMFDSSRFEQQAYIGSTMRLSAPRAGGDTHMPTQPSPNAEAQVPLMHRPAEKYADLDHSSQELTQGNHAAARFPGEHRHAHMQGHDRAAPGRGNSDFQQGPPGRSEFSGPQHQSPMGQGNRSRDQLPADCVAYGAMHPGRRVSDHHQHAHDNPSRGVHKPSPNPPVPKQAWPAGQRGNPDSAPLPTSHPQACQGSLPSPSTPVLQAYDSVSDAQRGMPRGSSTVAILKDVRHGAAPQGPGTPAGVATGASAAYERTGKYTNDPGQYQHPVQATGGCNAPAPVTATPTKSSHSLSEGSPFTHRPGPGSQLPQGQAPAPKQDDATVGHGRHLEDSPETRQSLPECSFCSEDIHGEYFTCRECDDELFCTERDQRYHKKRRSSHVRRPIKAKGAGGASNHNQKTSTSSSNFPTSSDQRPPPSNALSALTEVASPGSSLSPTMSSRSDGTGASAESSSSSASVPGSFDRLPLMSASTATAGASPPFRSQKASASQEEAMRKNRARLEYEEHMRKKAQTPPGPSVQPHNSPAVGKTSSTPGVDSDSDNDKFVSANSSLQHSGLQASPGTAPTAVSGLQAVPVLAKRYHRQSAANTQPPVPVPRQRQGSQFQRTTPKPDIVLSQQTADVATSSATPPKTPAKSGDLVAQSSNAKHTGPSAEEEDKLPSPEPLSFNPLELEVEKEEGQDYIHWMREVEKVGKFSMEDMATAHNVLLKGSRSSASTLIDHLSPVQWLHGQGFSEYRQVVRRQALELCPKIVQVNENEASEALCEAGMDAAKASMIVIERREKAAISVSDGLGVTKEAAHHVIGQANGDAEGARRSIAHHLFSPVLDRLWGQPDNGYDRTCDNDEKELIFPSLMTDVQAEFDQRARSAMAEIKCLNNISKAELAIRIYDRELSRDMSDVVLAASECLDLHGAERFLKVECAICMDTVPQHKLGSSCFCQCKVCAECLKRHYTVCIKDFVLPRFVCPSCQEPDILQLAKEQPETLQFYLSNFDIMVRNLLNDEEVHDLFAKKQRDFFLQRSPDFRWCPHCAGGFVNDIPNRLRVDCPYCGKKSCFQCKAKWEEQHEGMSCEVFEKWKADNDPEYQAKGLAAHMAMNGITCPNCNFGYELAIGGCMHFTCNQCKHEFCAGCNNAFMRLGECTWPEHKKMNFHCHCPRDCLSKLRDYPVGRLQMILENSNVGYRKDPTDAQVAQAREDAEGDEGAPIKCSIKLQKEGPDSKLYDEVCGDNTADDHAGLCEKHYKEYLVHEINVHALDPLLYMDKDEMLTVIRQSGMLADTPEQGDQLDEIYKGVLSEFVKDRIPLKRVRTHPLTNMSQK